jgi:hypothetical protein
MRRQKYDLDGVGLCVFDQPQAMYLLRDRMTMTSLGMSTTPYCTSMLFCTNPNRRPSLKAFPKRPELPPSLDNEEN